MVRMHLMPKDEAQVTRTPKTPGVRKQRMSQFDVYASMLLDNPAEAVVYEDIEEAPHKFLVSLRGAFKRAGAPAVVRKLRSRNEVRAWLTEEKAAPAPVKAGAPRGRPRKAG
jgi:hypothetical protein